MKKDEIYTFRELEIRVFFFLSVLFGILLLSINDYLHHQPRTTLIEVVSIFITFMFFVGTMYKLNKEV